MAKADPGRSRSDGRARKRAAPRNLKDVAARAGVSVGTVSRVINGNPTVSEELRLRVQSAIDALDYRPNVLARSLRRQTSQMVGLLVPDITNPFFSELAKHVELAAARSGWVVLLGNSMNSREIEDRYVWSLIDRQTDGVIVVPSEHRTEFAAARSIATVVVDRNIGGVDFVGAEIAGVDFVGADHEAGARMAVEHLVDLGHRRIGCISGPQPLAPAEDRYRGYVEVMRERLGVGAEALRGLTRFGPFDTETGRQAAFSLLSHEARPTALFAASDQQAVGALSAAAELGLSVPGQVSVVGFDDIPLARLWSPRLTTVSQPIAAIGQWAVDLLARRRTSSPKPRRIVLPTELTVRESTGAPNPAGVHRRAS